MKTDLKYLMRYFLKAGFELGSPYICDGYLSGLTGEVSVAMILKNRKLGSAITLFFTRTEFEEVSSMPEMKGKKIVDIEDVDVS